MVFSSAVFSNHDLGKFRSVYVNIQSWKYFCSAPLSIFLVGLKVSSQGRPRIRVWELKIAVMSCRGLITADYSDQNRHYTQILKIKT